MPWKQIGGRWKQVDTLDEKSLHSSTDNSHDRKAPIMMSFTSPGTFLDSPSSVSISTRNDASSSSPGYVKSSSSKNINLFSGSSHDRKSPVMMSFSSPGTFLDSPSSVSTRSDVSSPGYVKSSGSNNNGGSDSDKDTNAATVEAPEENPVEENQTEVNALNLAAELAAAEALLEEEVINEERIDEKHAEDSTPVIAEEPAEQGE